LTLAPVAASLCGLLIPATFLFYLACERRFSQHVKFTPLDVYCQPEIVKSENWPESKPNDNTVTYISPAYSKKITEVWPPEYVRHLISLGESLDQGFDGSNSHRWISLQDSN
jgi:hypothetical protein